MKRHEEARRLLELANKDLKALCGMATDSETFADEVFGFHAQQAVEKIIKAWLTRHDLCYPKTHDLQVLFASLKEAGVVIPSRFDELTDLVDFAVQYRYESFDEDLSIDRRKVLEDVTGFMVLARSKILKRRNRRV